MKLPDLSTLEHAARIVYQAMPPTPQFSWPLLSEHLGTELWVKHENHTPLGAFKVRGGLVYFDELKRREPRVSGVIAATRGNHGQSIAFAAQRHGLRAAIVVPHGNSREKNEAMRARGVELIEHGSDFQDALEEATRLAEGRGLHMVPSFHEALVRGVASYSLELFRAVPDVETLYVPIGLGSGICGAIAARQALSLRTEIVGVVAESAPAYAESFRKRCAVSRTVEPTVADGMACRVPNEEALEIIFHGVERIVIVTEDEIRESMRHIYTATHNLVEGAGAAAFAAALQERARLRGRRVAVVLTGANVDRDVFAKILSD
ncbi:MAG TPA: threonine dehydratase [Steroidobacteraceae bacterium]